MEVGDHCVHHAERTTWIQKQLRLSAAGLHGPVILGTGLQYPATRRPNRNDTTTTDTRRRNSIRSLL